MLQLRMTQSAVGEGRHRVDISLDGDGARQRAVSSFAFRLPPQDEEDLRWYLEDYLQYPQEPAPAIARRIEGRMAGVGQELFEAVFQANPETREVWSRVREQLGRTRIEIATGVTAASPLPWELLREPERGTALALAAHSFVRTQPEAAPAPRLPDRKAGKIRILLVICRPRGGNDIPFRSVAKRLVEGLDTSSRTTYGLDLLRPPTFERLGQVLRQAAHDRRPYHAVHFDGHGMYREVRRLRPGAHGYIWFENPDVPSNGEVVDGTSLGRLLADNGVPVLVLNACRSAHAEPAAQPAPATDDLLSRVRAFGSFAEEVLSTGVAGVLAMRYNVYVVTAAQLVAELYAHLSRGGTLGEAVTAARRTLAENPLRDSFDAPLPLQDWPVPVVYEATPLPLFPEREGAALRIAAGATAAATAGLDPDLPPPPEAGFFGRDETLLALDRTFDRASVVLLHAYAGSGKTTAAAEFARWYALTGGVDGSVLFSTFERYLPLPRVLDRIGEVFADRLESAGIQWPALDDAARRTTALQLLAQRPVLWIWDNVEPVNGFPAGTASAWTPAEQQELRGFLGAAAAAGAKFLLTSRRGEGAWLGDLPVRLGIPPMPMTESLQLTRALARRYGHRTAEVEDWRPLLAFAKGNPMTLTVLVGQAFQQGLSTRDQVDAFVARLRSGEAAFTDESEGRSRSLGASLAYGFDHAFREEERRRLALLHLFQGFVDVDAVGLMGDPDNPACLPDLQGFSREAWIALLDRAAEVGLLTPLKTGYYSIHPALPWFFRGLFARSYATAEVSAVRSFAEAIGERGNSLAQEYTSGHRHVVSLLRAHEPNLLFAHRLARQHGWPQAALRTLQGLRWLYDHTSRRAEWKRLVEEITPLFVDPVSGGPLQDWEEGWLLVTEVRVQVAVDEARWDDAERLHLACLQRDRQNAAGALAKPVAELDFAGWNAIRSLAVALHQLGRIRRERQDPGCVQAYREALALAQRIGEREGAARSAFDLGHSFLNIPALQDLDQGEHWFRTSLSLRAEDDRIGRGKCLAQCGLVATLRYLQTRSRWFAGKKAAGFLADAIKLYQEALKLLPADAVHDLAILHNQLGALYGFGEDSAASVRHLRQAIDYYEKADNPYKAAGARYNVAVTLSSAGRRQDALEYAEAALRGYERCGPRAADDVQETRRLIAGIRG